MARIFYDRVLQQKPTAQRTDETKEKRKRGKKIYRTIMLNLKISTRGEIFGRTRKLSDSL